MLELFLFSMLLGAIAGILAGLFGLGGGIVIVPALVWLFSAHQFPEEQIMIMAIATSLASIIFTSISSVYSHHRLDSILWDRVFRLIPGIFFGAGLGALVADTITAESLKWFFISYLIYVGIRMAWQSEPTTSIKKVNSGLDYLVGNGIGLLSSLLGIGGGTLTVPYLLGQHVAIKNAVAISSACGLPIAISGTVVYILLGWDKPFLPEWSIGYIYLPSWCGITLFSILTAPVGAKLAYILPAKKLKRFFSILVFLIALKMIIV